MMPTATTPSTDSDPHHAAARGIARRLACVCAALAVTAGALMAGGCAGRSLERTDRDSMRTVEPTINPTAQQDQRLAEADAMRSSGDYQRAIVLLEGLLAENPTLVDAYVGLGATHLAAGDYESAEPAYARAARLEPSNFDAQYGHGTVLQLLKRFADAIRAYHRALVLRPDDPEVNLAMASAYLESGNPSSAVIFARKAVEIEPDDPEARARLASALARSGLHDDAVREYEIALELTEPSEELLLALIGSYMEARRWNEAANASETLVRLYPSAEAWERLGRSRFRLSEFEISMDAYREAVALDPQHWPSLNGLGVNALNAWLRSDRQDQAMASEAKDAFQRSLRANPRQPKLVEILNTYRL